MSKGDSVNINLGGGSLLICLILLKAFNVVDWSWWWILCPLWLPIAFILAFFAVVFIIAIVTAILGEIFR